MADERVERSTTAHFRPSAEGPVTVVFGTALQFPLIERWTACAREAGCTHYRIVCMDDALRARLEHSGEQRALSFRDIVPEAECEIPDTSDLYDVGQVRVALLTAQRIALYRALVAMDCDFIHSDADAFWRSDPRPWLMRQAGYDVLFAHAGADPQRGSGTGFEVGAGFFLCRANRRTRAFLAALAARRERCEEDRIGGLLRKWSVRWDMRGSRLVLDAAAGRRRGPLVMAAARLLLAGAHAFRLRLERPLARAGLATTMASAGVIGGKARRLAVGIIPERVVAWGSADRPADACVFRSLDARAALRDAAPPYPACLFQPDPTEGPVTVVVGTWAYRPLIERWIDHAHRAGCKHYRIVCMDDRLLSCLRERPGGSRAVSFYDVCPQVPPTQAGIDSVKFGWRRRRVLTPLRCILFERLLAWGCDFVHSDADALWLRDPRPWLARQEGYDMLFSQDRRHPADVFEANHFVLCCGFFLWRANDRTRALVSQRGFDRHRSDQLRYNKMLLADPRRRWRVVKPRLALGVDAGGWVWRALPLGTFGHRCLGYLIRLAWCCFGAGFDRRLLGPKRRLMLQSDAVMRGEFSRGLSVGVIPMRLVARMSMDVTPQTCVAHVDENKRILPEYAAANPGNAPGAVPRRPGAR